MAMEQITRRYAFQQIESCSDRLPSKMTLEQLQGQTLASKEVHFGAISLSLGVSAKAAKLPEGKYSMGVGKNRIGMLEGTFEGNL